MPRTGAGAFGRLDPPPRTVFSVAVDGRAYARRGTGFATRLTVVDRDPERTPSVAIDPDARVNDAAALLRAVVRDVPPRLPLAPVPGDLFGPRPAKVPAARAEGRTRKAQSEARSAEASGQGKPEAPEPHGWGPVAELAYETGGTDGDDPNAGVEGGDADAGATEHPSTGAGAVYEPWRPRTVRIAGAAEHPTPLVQSAAMAAVAPPAPSYRPRLPVRGGRGRALVRRPARERRARGRGAFAAPCRPGAGVRGLGDRRARRGRRRVRGRRGWG